MRPAKLRHDLIPSCITFKTGDVVKMRQITAIDNENHKISLSIRALSEPAPAAEPVEEEPESGEDALVYEVSTTGEATGNVVED